MDLGDKEEGFILHCGALGDLQSFLLQRPWLQPGYNGGREFAQ